MLNYSAKIEMQEKSQTIVHSHFHLNRNYLYQVSIAPRCHLITFNNFLFHCCAEFNHRHSFVQIIHEQTELKPGKRTDGTPIESTYELEFDPSFLDQFNAHPAHFNELQLQIQMIYMSRLCHGITNRCVPFTMAEEVNKKRSM